MMLDTKQQLLKCKQEVIAALKDQAYGAALGILCDARDRGVCIMHDPLLSDLLNTLQQKAFQDESVEDDQVSSSSDTTSDDSNCRSTGSDSDEDNSGASSICSQPGAQENITAVAHLAAGLQGCDLHDPLTSHHTQGSPEPSADESSRSLEEPAQQHGAAMLQTTERRTNSCDSSEALPHSVEVASVVSRILLAPGSCALTHSQRADMRRQLAASLDDAKAAAVLERALADDPLLSASIA